MFSGGHVGEEVGGKSPSGAAFGADDAVVGLWGSAVEGEAAGGASTNFEQCAGVAAADGAGRREADDEQPEGEEGDGGDPCWGDTMSGDESFGERAADHEGGDDEDGGASKEVERLVALDDALDAIDFPGGAADAAEGGFGEGAGGDLSAAIVTKLRGEEEHVGL